MAEKNSVIRAQFVVHPLPSYENQDSSAMGSSEPLNVQSNSDEVKACVSYSEPNPSDELRDIKVYCENEPVTEKESAVSAGESALEMAESCSNCKGLQKKLAEEEKRCAVLRANIHKVSANWFQRKTQLSESEADVETPPVGLLDQTMKVEDPMPGEVEVSATIDSRDGVSKSKDLTKFLSMIAQKSAQLEVSDSQCHDLKRRLRECEKIIDDKEDIIHGLKDQLETYLTDNQQMSLQLNNLAVLFQQLEKADQEVVSKPRSSEDAEDTATAVPLPTENEFQEMTKSVSKTYIKLKDLIYEKKALVTEIERLNTLNVELQKRVVQQETRLMSVTDALHQTWLVVSDLKEQHAKLHDDELIMRYELKQKRNILTKLRRELESSRAQWQMIRQKNQESEEEYASIRAMLRERRKETSESISEQEEPPEEPDEAVCLHPDDAKSFDPPVDLLLEMGLEYGIIGEEAEMTQTVLDVIGGEDVRHNRLEQLEEHCSLLYQKLLASTSRSLFLASRLSRLHRQFGSSDEEEEVDDFVMEVGDEEEEEGEGEENQEDDDDQTDDGEEGAEYYTDADRIALMESVLSSPVSEEYDTAYVSETEAVEPQTGLTSEVDVDGSEPTPGPSGEPQVVLESDQPTTVDSSDNLSSDLDESCDHLSRTLINFLPRKIEFLKKENKKLESQLKTIKEEREAAETRATSLEKDKDKLEDELKVLAKDIAMEKLQRQQLEDQLKHLGKCVDQLKLDQHSETHLHSETTSPPSPSDPGLRSEVQRRPEEEKLKREVSLLKREMEVKKKERQLRNREEEMAKREAEMKGANTEAREGEGVTTNICCPEGPSLKSIIAAAKRIVEENLAKSPVTTTEDYSSSLVVVPWDVGECSTSTSSLNSHKITVDKQNHLAVDTQRHNAENNTVTPPPPHFLRTNPESREDVKKTEPSNSREDCFEKATWRQEEGSVKGLATNEVSKNLFEQIRNIETFIIAPFLCSDKLDKCAVSAKVSLQEHVALLVPFKLGVPGTGVPGAMTPGTGVPTSGTADTGTQETCTPSTSAPTSDTADTGTQETCTPSTSAPTSGTGDTGTQETCTPSTSVPVPGTEGAVAPEVPTNAVALRIAAIGQSVHVTAFKHACSSTSSPPSSPPAACDDTSVLMPVMRVMKDEAITITITSHSHIITTIIITSDSTSGRDGAAVQYDVWTP